MAYVRMQCREGLAFCIYTECFESIQQSVLGVCDEQSVLVKSENGIDLGKKADSGVYGLVN